jgi:hypothetical protein
MKKSFVVLACTTVAIALSACSGTTAASNQSESTVTPKPSQSAPASAPKSESSFKDGVLTTSKLKIAITDHKVIPVGAAGNEYGKKPVIAFWYQTTNLSDKEVSPMDFIFGITVYQDNNPNRENKLNVGSLPDPRFGDSQTAKIKKGGTVENAIAYELDDLTTPVDLVASENVGMDKIGKVTYTLK